MPLVSLTIPRSNPSRHGVRAKIVQVREGHGKMMCHRQLAREQYWLAHAAGCGTAAWAVRLKAAHRAHGSGFGAGRVGAGRALCRTSRARAGRGLRSRRMRRRAWAPRAAAPPAAGLFQPTTPAVERAPGAGFRHGALLRHGGCQAPAGRACPVRRGRRQEVARCWVSTLICGLSAPLDGSMEYMSSPHHGPAAQYVPPCQAPVCWSM